jgi:SAM-dependent methyltransferase
MFMREGKSMDNRSAAVAQAVELIRQSKAGRGDHDYISFHSRRWKYLFELCLRFLPPRQSRVLDIGRTQFSYDLAGYYSEVETLGFPLEGDVGGHTALRHTPPKTIPHVVFDLNQAQDPGSWPRLQPFDLIVLAEVIEHIHTAPELVFLFLRSILKPGGTLICQTPNAVWFPRRIEMLKGVQPFERIRCYDKNPGHFREYTGNELRELGELCGFEILRHEFMDYFGPELQTTLRPKRLLYKCLTALFPALRSGQTIVFRLP